MAVRLLLLFGSLCLSSLAFSASCSLVFLHAAFELLPFLLLRVQRDHIQLHEGRAAHTAGLVCHLQSAADTFVI